MIYAIVVVVALILDQGMKYWTSVSITAATGDKSLIPGIIGLTNVHNTGAAFSFLDDLSWARWLFAGLAIIASALIIYALAKNIIKGRFGKWSASFIMAGALGNCIDRLINGYVVDMFKIELFNFPIFNVADIFLTVGAILFCLYVILHRDIGVETAPTGKAAAAAKPRQPAKRPPQKSGKDLSRHTANIETIQKPKARISDVPSGNIASVARPSSGSKSPLKQQSDNKDNDKTPRASSAPPAQPPRRRDVDIDTPEYTLEDIIAEFSDMGDD